MVSKHGGFRQGVDFRDGEEAYSFHLVKDGVVTAVNLITSVHVSGKKKCCVALPNKLNLPNQSRVYKHVCADSERE